MRFLRPRPHYVMGLLGLLAFAAGGCGGGNSSRGGSASLSLPWGIYDVSDTNSAYPLDCANDVGGRDLVVTLTNQATNQSFTFTFDCESGAGTTGYVPAGTYTVTVDLYGDPKVYGNNNTILDQYPAWTQDLFAGPNSVATLALVVNSYVLSWTITSGGLPTTCAAVGARWVALDVYYAGQSQPTSYFLDCTAGTQATLAIPVGTYTISWQAFLDDASQRDITQGTTLVSFTVRNDPNQTRLRADLGAVYFPF